jgi:predicted nucleotidyltransferase
MAKIPHKPDAIFEEITTDFKAVFKGELISIILYGSGARPDYRPGKSDINFLITLTRKGIDGLFSALDVVAKWKKRNVATPLFMTREDMLSSLDSFPVEFLNMKWQHVLVYGEDVLTSLVFPPEPLRLQVEREFKAKILHLRKGFMETEGREKHIRQLIRASLTAFAALFEAMLHLKNIEVPKTRRGIIQAAAQAFAFDGAPFMKCEDVRDGKNNLSSTEIQALFINYLKEVSRASDIIDHLDPSHGPESPINHTGGIQ